jgi:polyisoprenoid-binding protein YceI
VANEGAASAVPLTRYQLDSSHTSVYFAVTHFGISTMRGRFMGISGQLAFDAAQGSGSLDLTIDPDSVDTGLRGLDAVLKSSQFFDTKEFPQARFQSTRFEFEGERLLAVHGTLNLHGVSQPLVLQAQRFQCREVKIIVLRRFVCGGDFSAKFLRSSFGMRQHLPDVGDEIALDIAVEASPVK